LRVLSGARRLLVLGDGAAWIRAWFESLGISLKAMIANRQRIVYLFPPSHRLDCDVLFRHRIAQIVAFWSAIASLTFVVECFP